MSILPKEARDAQQCPICSNPIPKSRLKNGAKYCSNSCGQKFHRSRAGSSIHTRTCLVCEKPFSFFAKSSEYRQYCSAKCRRESVRQCYHGDRHPGVLPNGTVGAISELFVAADLLRQGFEVFRALSPSCSCDLAILYKLRLIRVEVRTAAKTKTGKVSFPFKSGEESRHDLLALVMNNGREIEYRPPLSELFQD